MECEKDLCYNLCRKPRALPSQRNANGSPKNSRIFSTPPRPPISLDKCTFFDVFCKLLNLKITSKQILWLKNSWKIWSHKNVQNIKNNFEKIHINIRQQTTVGRHSVMTDRLCKNQSGRFVMLFEYLEARQRQEWTWEGEGKASLFLIPSVCLLFSFQSKHSQPFCPFVVPPSVPQGSVLTCDSILSQTYFFM